MTRVTSQFSRPAAVAAFTAAILAIPAIAFGDAGFTARNSISATPPDYNAVPYDGTSIVVYALPTLAVSPFHGADVNASADLVGVTSPGGTEAITGFGMIANLTGTGLSFNPAAIAGGANPPNNILYSVTGPSNIDLDIMYGVTNVQGGGSASLGVVALNEVPATNITLSTGQGLANIPILVAAGTTYGAGPGANAILGSLNFGTDPTYTGFINAAGQIVTSPASSTNVGVEVRKSLIADYNGDGFVDFGDIDGFNLQLFGNPGDYEAANPYLAQVSQFIGDLGGDPGDINCTADGFVDFTDIDGFNERLFGAGCVTDPSPSAVPEPSMVLLVLMGLMGAAAWARRRGK